MSDSVTLFHVSDVHFGVENKAAHHWFAQGVAGECPDAVICTGDITQRAKKREYTAAREWFAALDVPIVIEPGNHDLPYYNLIERFRTPFRRYEALADAVGGDLDLPDMAVVSLRTTVRAQTRFPWSDGVVKPAALARTVTALEQLRGDARLKVVACHHPLMEGPPGSPNPTINGDEAFEALAKAGADVILSGHVHNAFDITHAVAGRQVRMIGAGTLSTRLRGSVPSYNVLRYEAGGELTVEHRHLAS